MRLSVPENNPNYKGNNIGYIGLHLWLRKISGHPKKCLRCGKFGKEEKGQWNIDFALIKGMKYERKVENFIGLCSKCHRAYDSSETWNQNMRKAKLGIKMNKDRKYIKDL
jgi:hypothetical protein